MYTVQLNDDKSVSTIINQRINVGYQNSDWFWFLIKPSFQQRNTLSNVVSIEFVLPVSKKTITETLVAKNEYYGSYLKYALSKYSKLTKESGWVEMKIIFTDSSGSVSSDTFKVGVSTDEDYHDDILYDNPEIDGSGYDQKGCTCDMDAEINKVIEMTRPLVYDSVSSAVDELNSERVKNIYLGQSVIIVSNGKYLLYSIQQGADGYVVEPVDTVGEGSVWEEED